MKFRKLTGLILLVILSLVLVACDSDDGGNDDGPGEDTDSPIELSESYTGEDGLSFSMPSDWVAVAEFGQVTIASSQEAIDTMNQPEATSLGDGNIAAVIALLPGEMLGALGLEDEATISEVMGAFTSVEGGPELGDIEEFDAGGNSAAIASGSLTNEGTTIDTAIVTIALDGAFAVFNFVADEGQISDADAIIRAIAGSASYTAPDAGGEG